MSSATETKLMTADELLMMPKDGFPGGFPGGNPGGLPGGNPGAALNLAGTTWAGWRMVRSSERRARAPTWPLTVAVPLTPE